MMLHRHFEDKKKLNLTKAADLRSEPKGMDPEDPLYVSLEEDSEAESRQETGLDGGQKQPQQEEIPDGEEEPDETQDEGPEPQARRRNKSKRI